MNWLEKTDAGMHRPPVEKSPLVHIVNCSSADRLEIQTVIIENSDEFTRDWGGYPEILSEMSAQYSAP